MTVLRNHVASRVLGLALGLTSASCSPTTVEIPLSSTTDGPASSGSGPGSGTTGTTNPTADTTADATTDTTADTDTTAGCTPADAFGDWWDDRWHRRRLLEIDTSIFSDPVLAQPVLVRLDAMALGATWSQRGGDDLRFRSADGRTALPYDIDDVDADGELSIWLKVPQLDPGAGPVSVSLYHDNPEAPPGADPGSVWAGFLSVHHLGTDLRDSAGDHHGSANWEPELCDERCEPRIGVARTFVPEQLHDVVLDDEQDYDLGVDPFQPEFDFTITAWMRSTTLSSYPWGPLVAKGDHTWRLQTTGGSPPYDDRIALGLDCYEPACDGLVDLYGNFNVIGYDATNTVPDDVDDGAWHHVATTFALANPEEVMPGFTPRTRVGLYVDGALVTEEEYDGLVLPPGNDQPVRIGYNINNAFRFSGELDELRIMVGARTPEELAADYLTVAQDHVAVQEEQVTCP